MSKPKIFDKMKKIKKSVAYDTNKKLKELEKKKEEDLVKELEVELEKEKEYTKSVEDLFNKMEVKLQKVENELNNLVSSYSNLQVKYKETKKELEKQKENNYKLREGLKFYSEGKHWQTGAFTDKVIEKGEYATSILDQKKED